MAKTKKHFHSKLAAAPFTCHKLQQPIQRRRRHQQQLEIVAAAITRVEVVVVSTLCG